MTFCWHSVSAIYVGYRALPLPAPVVNSKECNCFLLNIKLGNGGLKDTVLAPKCTTLNMIADAHFGRINFPCDANHFIL